MRILASIATLFFFNDTATTEIYTLSLHDALPISAALPDGRGGRAHRGVCRQVGRTPGRPVTRLGHAVLAGDLRSEEHTSELQSQSNLVCRLLLEKKKTVENFRGLDQAKAEKQPPH